MNRERLLELLEACQDLALDGAGGAELAAELRASAEARELYWECFALHALLGETLAERRAGVAVSDGAAKAVEGGGLRAEGADAGRVEGRRLKAGGLESPVAPTPSTHNRQPATVPTPPPSTLHPQLSPVIPQPAVARPSLRARLTWIVVAAAAALIVGVSGLHVLGLLPTRYTTIEIFGPSGGPKEHRLYDGTVVTAAAGARAEARGADDARKVRQLIVLREGQIEVRAPKALPGEVACRVETPEGLWVETVGTTFKVTRAWENEKGEQNVDKSKLAGIVTAVLLVAVSEGEVRTGRGQAGEARVAAGGDAAIRATGAPKVDEKTAWGQAVNGLAVGLSVGRIRLEAERGSRFDPIALGAAVCFRNAGSERIRLAPPSSKTVELRDAAGKTVPMVELGRDPRRTPAPEDFPFLAGLSTSRLALGWQYTMGPHLGLGVDWDGSQYATREPLPAGKYRLRLVYENAAAQCDVQGTRLDGLWVGKAASGPVEIEIVAPGKAEESISWGQAANGLQAGLAVKQARLDTGQPVELAIHVANRGAGAIKVQDGLGPRAWRIEFAPAAGGRSIRAAVEAIAEDKRHADAALPKGGAAKLDLSVGRPEWVFGTVGLLDEMAALPAGRYAVTASYEHAEHSDDCPFWHGKVATGSVEIEVGAASAAGKAAWGEAVNGLQGRLEAEKGTIAPGEDIRLTFWLRTDEKQRESLYVWDNIYSNGYRNDSYLVKMPDGKIVTLRRPELDSWDKNVPAPVEIRPGVPWKLGGWAGQVNVKSLKSLGLDTTQPGIYTVTGAYEEAAADAGDAGFARHKGIKVWGGKLTTPPIAVVVAELGRAGQSAAGGDWLKLLEGQPAYQAKPGAEQLFTGRLDLLRPITELHDFAYAVTPADGAKGRFTLGVGILPALEKLKDAELAAGRAPVVQVRGKLEKDVQLYKGDGGKGAVLWPAAIRLAVVAAAAPSFSAKCDKPGDKVAAELAGGALTLTVTSPGGIGSAEVKPEKGQWPKKVTVRLALKGLEGFGAECGGKKLSGRLGGGGKDELAAEKKGEFIEVALPEGFAAGEKAILKISWVDFYR